MKTRSMSLAMLAGVVALATVPPSCTVKEPTPSTYFDRTIAPILTTSCARGPTGAGCHVADAKGNAFGNLDLSTFAGVDLRRDLLVDYGPYQQPALLLKTTSSGRVVLTAYDGKRAPVTLDVRHTGGPILDATATAYMTLRRWIAGGATVNNGGPLPPPAATSACRETVPSAVGFDPSADPATDDFSSFRDAVAPLLTKSCGAGNCHGFRGNPLHLLCSDTPEQVRWNYQAATGYLASTADASELLQRPLGSASGGTFHEGGVVFSSATDAGYATILEWAKRHGPVNPGTVTPGFDFFAHRVQPALVRKGCLMLQCHSASSFNDLQYSGGAGGGFSFAATRRNYTLSRAQLALESDDPNASRLVRKNLYRPELADGGMGIVHRGGPLLEDFGDVRATAATCDTHLPAYDYDGGSVDDLPAYCIVREWLRRERADARLSPLTALVYVRRPISVTTDRLQDFDVYAPGAELRIVAATMGAGGAITLGATTPVDAACGLDPATADVRRPTVSWDGSRVAFAARTSAAEPLAIYEMNADGSACAKNADIAAHPPSANGLLVHDFDPAYSPPEADGSMHLVFASTRGNAASPAVDYVGPQRSTADPTKANANIYAYEPSPGGGTRVRQLTFLLAMERAPSFMADGRVVFTVEKREPGNYQLALRRQNIDGGDYHPLYGQRSSLGFREVSQVVHLADKNFAVVCAEPGVPHHGGALGVFNRSIGVDFTSRDTKDFPVDPSVADPASPSSPEASFFLHSLRLPDPSATGRLHGATSGLYSSPSPLPDDRILVSFGTAADSASFDGDYDIYVLDQGTGRKTRLLGDAGFADVDAVAVYARAPRGVYHSTWNDPNAFGVDPAAWAVDVVQHDAPTIHSLMFQNTPTGRMREHVPSFEIWEELPPPLDVASFAQAGAFAARDEFGQVYVRRRLLGAVPVLADGSAHWRMPGGMPFVVHLPDTPESQGRDLPRWQREGAMFAPGEQKHEGFPAGSFDGFCAMCHASISGRPVDAALRPDLFTHASESAAMKAPAVDVALPPPQRGPPVGPPASP